MAMPVIRYPGASLVVAGNIDNMKIDILPCPGLELVIIPKGSMLYAGPWCLE